MRFRLHIVFRISVILTFGAAAIYTVFNTYFWLVGIWLILFFVIAILELVRFLEKSKRELTNFLISIKQNDFTTSYSSQKEANSEQKRAFKIITEEFNKLRQQKESNYHFLQAVVAHSGVPMIGYLETTGEVTLMNQSVKDLFKKPFIQNIDALKKINEGLWRTITTLQSGERNLLKLNIGNESIPLSITAKELKLDGHLFKLVTFQNIKKELDEKELESWQKLIRVLTHEIKNSAIPISTLTGVINQMITDEVGNLKDLSTLNDEDLDDLKLGLKTVEKRSKGLVKFVNAYGQLAKIPTPKSVQVNLNQLVIDVITLMKSDFKKAGIQLKIEVQPILINLDISLIEQVLINLLKNAREALKNQPKPEITIGSNQQGNHITLFVKDNGEGISIEKLENIFIPFYTTKPTGSGIGLSLSKQIMAAHEGEIMVNSIQDKGTEFQLIFKGN